MKYKRMRIEIESPEEMGYGSIKYNLAESSVTDGVLGDLDVDLDELVLCYGDHKGLPDLREAIAAEGDGLNKEDVITTAGAAHPRKFYKNLLKKYGTYVGPGHWFDMDDRYFRLGYGWPAIKELKGGLEGIIKALHSSE
jgi:aspartate/methionine/tyrosine aminotransferase